MAPSVTLMNIQAESMIESALHNRTNFLRNAKAFFKSANTEQKNGYGVQGNALTAYYGAVRKAQQNTPNVNVLDTVKNKIVNGISVDKELAAETAVFQYQLHKAYEKNLGARIALLDRGAVVPDKIKPVGETSTTDRLAAKANNLIYKIIRIISNVEE